MKQRTLETKFSVKLGTSLLVPLAFASLIGTSALGASAQSKSSDDAKKLSELVSFENDFNTARDLLNDLTQSRVLTVEEQAGINNFAIERNINLDSPLSKAKVDGNKVHFGKSTITWLDHGSLKTDSGHVVVSHAGETADQVFISTYNALTTHDTASLFDLLIKPAHADVQQTVDPSAEVGAAILNMVSFVPRVVLTVAAIPSIAVCGIPAVLADNALHRIRESKKYLNVRCVNGSYYRMNDLGIYWGVNEDYHWERWREQGEQPITLSTDIDSAFYAACAAPVQRLDPNTSATVRDRMIPVSPEIIAMSYKAPHHPPKSCTRESAHHVEDYLRHQHDAAETKIKKAMADSQGTQTVNVYNGRSGTQARGVSN